jgi:hypothetical protein
VLEEFGASRWSRDALYASTYDISWSAASAGGAAGGDLFWLLAGSPKAPDYDTYTVYMGRDASTLALVTNQVARMRQLDAVTLPPAAPAVLLPPPPPPPPPLQPPSQPPPYPQQPPYPGMPPTPDMPDAPLSPTLYGTALGYLQQ